MNIMLSRDKTVKLADFGTAKKFTKEDQFFTSFVGTMTAMAPELWVGETYTQKTDVWSVGVLLFQMICGKLPFNAANNAPATLMEKV